MNKRFMSTSIRKLAFTTTLLALILVTGCDGNSSSGLTGEAIDQKTRVTKMLDEFMQNPALVGSMIRVDDGTSGGTFSVSRGDADQTSGTLMSDAHQFHIASMTKPFTATLLLQLIEEGELTLDTTLGDFFGTQPLSEIFTDYSFSDIDPDGNSVATMTIDDLQRFEGEARGSDITMRMLIQHSHGMPDLTFDAPAQSNLSLSDWLISWFVGLVPEDQAPRTQWSGLALLEYYLGSGLPSQSFFEPGNGYHYGDTGFVIAALVIERITGMTLVEVYRNRIFDPLGMDDTYLAFYEPERQSESIGLSHRNIDLTEVSTAIGNVDVDGSNWYTSVDWAGGGLVSTAADLDRFLRGLFQGTLLSASSLLADSGYWITADDGDFELYSLGIGIRTNGDGTTLKSYDHGGFWGSYMAYYPERDTTVVLTVNQVIFDNFDTVLEVLDELFF